MMVQITQILECITAVAALVAVALGLVNRSKISEVHVLINSRMDTLLQLTASASRAEGVNAGREESIKT